MSRFRKIVYVAMDVILICMFLAGAILWGFDFEQPTRFLATVACFFAAVYWVHVLGRDLDA